MLNSLTLKNFQAHVDSYLEFSPGVNVIIGESDEGKSSIIRAIQYLTQNRPTRNNFKHRYTKDPMHIIGVFDDNKIVRTKSKAINTYTINNGEPFKALKTEVPDEVSAIIKMTSTNIQSQDDAYYMLSMKPGQIAKKINKVVDLDIMHEVLKSIKNDVFTAKEQLTFYQNKRNKYTDKLNALEWVEDCRYETDRLTKQKEYLHTELTRYNHLDQLGEKHNSIDQKLLQYVDLSEATRRLHQLEKSQEHITIQIKKFNVLDQLNEKCTSIDQELSQYIDLSEVIEQCIQLEKSQEHINTQIKKFNTLKRLTETAQAVVTQFNAYSCIAKAMKHFDELVRRDKVMHEKYYALKNLLIYAIESKKKLKLARSNYERARNTFDRAMKKAGVCPLCERKT